MASLVSIFPGIPGSFDLMVESVSHIHKMPSHIHMFHMFSLDPIENKNKRGCPFSKIHKKTVML